MTSQGLRVRVVGSSPAVPRPGSACSCYLIESGGTSLIFDCGTGALQSLQRYIDPTRLTAVLISHVHPDHVFDLIALRYLRAFAGSKPPLLDVYIPPAATPLIERLALASASSEGERFFERSMRVQEYDPHHGLKIDRLHLTFAPTTHYIDAYAMRVSDGRAAVAYSADTAPCDRVVELARDADLFICECALGPVDVDRPPRGHCNAREAGEMAGAAGAKHLVLSHYGSEHDPKALAAAAAAAFDGSISVADDGWLATL